VSEPTEYQGLNTLEVRHDFIIPEAQDVEPFLTEKCIARAVSLSVHMLSAIHFYDQSRFQAGEIGDVRPDGMLPTETEAFQLAVLENGPEFPLRQRHVPPQLARAVAFLSLSHGHILCSGYGGILPPSQPSPASGGRG
jgi:hypothetical protein